MSRINTETDGVAPQRAPHLAIKRKKHKSDGSGGGKR
jgi:hypothetical protein